MLAQWVFALCLSCVEICHRWQKVCQIWQGFLQSRWVVVCCFEWGALKASIKRMDNNWQDRFWRICVLPAGTQWASRMKISLRDLAQSKFSHDLLCNHVLKLLLLPACSIVRFQELCCIHVPGLPGARCHCHEALLDANVWTQSEPSLARMVFFKGSRLMYRRCRHPCTAAASNLTSDTTSNWLIRLHPSTAVASNPTSHTAVASTQSFCLLRPLSALLYRPYVSCPYSWASRIKNKSSTSGHW